MQIDMHYYGTYAMARAAGIRPESAKIIATAAQFVDDAVMTDDYDCKDGSCIVVEATGHHSEDVRNLLPVDQRKVWLPFHFLPGNQGVSFLERLTCGKDSAVAREMIERNLVSSTRPFARELIGITAHVYADTFAHYGFSGISSPLNRVHGGSIKVDVENPEIRKYITDKAGRFYRKYGAGFLRRMGKRIRALISETAETLSGALGHGAVATYPDRPYLRWNFNYEESNASSRRDNQVTYLEACEALHNVFSQFAANAPKAFSDLRTARPFSAIKETVAGVLGKEAVCDDRISAWQKAAREGKLYDPAEGAIPSYEGGAWEAKLKAFKGKPAPTEATELPAYRFYQAASRHRHTVLREILPAHGIVVV